MNKRSIPIELIQYCTGEELRKPLALLLAMNMHSSGKIKRFTELSNIAITIGMKDKRTLKKHLNALLDYNWVGYNPISEIYFVRSFDKIRVLMGFKKRTSVTLYSSDLSNVQNWCDAVIVNSSVRDQKFYWEIARRRFKRPVLTKEDSANPVQRVDPMTKPPYYGLSNYTIGKHLNCSISQACKRKRKAAKLGYLICKPHLKVIAKFPKADYRIREKFIELYPSFRGKLRFRTIVNEGNSVIQLVQQLHDEVIPNTVFTRRKRIASSIVGSPASSFRCRPASISS